METLDKKCILIPIQDPKFGTTHHVHVNIDAEENKQIVVTDIYIEIEYSKNFRLIDSRGSSVYDFFDTIELRYNGIIISLNMNDMFKIISSQTDESKQQGFDIMCGTNNMNSPEKICRAYIPLYPCDFLKLKTEMSKEFECDIYIKTKQSCDVMLKLYSESFLEIIQMNLFFDQYYE
jgi:hypothetical protein